MYRGSAVCFAFGQTGAGKTHTLLGTKSEPGLYQLAAADLFTLAQQGSKSYGQLNIWASYYEIYCGQLYDLLNKRKRLILYHCVVLIPGFIAIKFNHHFGSELSTLENEAYVWRYALTVVHVRNE